MTSLTREIADFIAENSYEQIPERAVAVAKEAILDGMGCILAGSVEPVSRTITEYVKELGGNPEATVIAGGFKTSAPQAALANGTLAHALDYDDVSFTWIAHPTVVLLPPVLALGEHYNASGREVLAAYILGFEIAARIGSVIIPHHYDIGWHATATLGTIGAATAAARILKLNSQQTRMALGIAASLAGGMRQNFGTMTKPFHAGNASKNGVVAAILASKGMTADENILEGPSGFCAIWGPGDEGLAKATQSLGNPWELVTTGMILKPYPCCRETHREIDAILHLREEHNINAEDVAEVRCITNAITPQILRHHRPKTALEGKFSMEYCMAVALLDGKVGLAQFTDKRVSEPRAQELLTRVKYIHPPGEIGIEAELKSPITITVKLKDDSEYSHEVMIGRGEPEEPMTDEQRFEKYRECAHTCLSEKNTERSLELLTNLETMENIEELMKIVKFPERSGLDADGKI
ncbi:MmgE/PrpD family protein [Chloroflexota bacterium]